MNIKLLMLSAAITIGMQQQNAFASLNEIQNDQNASLNNSSIVYHPRITDAEALIKKSQDFIKLAVQNARKAKDKDIVLVLGNTGAGKSTIINYLLGSKMKEDKFEGDRIAVPEQESSDLPKIGHTNVSETYFPSIYSTISSPLVYCDCPGFYDTGILADRVNVSIATQLMVNYARSIQSIIVVIDTLDLTHGRGDGIEKIGLTLGRLLKKPINSNSLLFLFNQKQDNSKDLDYVHTKIKSEIKKHSDKLQKISDPENEEYQSVASILSILKLINPNKGNSFLINIFDEFKSKNAIESLLYNLNATPKERFDFSEYDETRVKFNTQLFEVVGDMSNKLIGFSKASENLNINEERIKSCNQRIESYQTQIPLLAVNLAQVNNDQIEKLKTQETNYNEKLKPLRERIESIQQEISDLKNEQEKLDTGRPVLHWKDNIYDERAWLVGNLSWTKKTFTYKGLPFTAVLKNSTNGKFKNEKREDVKGNYQITYVSDRGKTGDAGIEIYLPSRERPDNMKRLKEISEQLKNKEEVYSQYDKEIKECESSLANAKDLIRYYQADGQTRSNQIKGREKYLTDEIKRAEREKEDLTKQNELYKNMRHETKSYIKDKESLLDAVFDLVSYGLQSDSLLIENFKKYYSNYKAIEAGNLHHTEAYDDVYSSDNFICPISNELYQDPVITRCGHTFEHRALISWLSQKENCPTCRTHVNEHDLSPNTNLRNAIQDFVRKKSLKENKLEESMLNLNLIRFKEKQKDAQQGEINSITEEVIKRQKEIEAQEKELKKKKYDLEIMQKTLEQYKLVTQEKESNNI